MFTPLRSERLVIRPVSVDDVDALAARRNEPDVARLQSWEVPFGRARAAALIEGAIAQRDPQVDAWWMLTVTLPDGSVIGDLALRLEWDGRAAEIGYSFGREWWGHGYATEAVETLLEWLFETRGVSRVHATIHPDNVASAMVLERTGFEYEGRTKLSYWVGPENTDDVLYGMTAPMWRTWIARPLQPPAEVQLVEIDQENSSAALRLRTHKTQEQLVAPVVHSFADALIPEVIDGGPVVPWIRGVEADGEMVGFVMIAEVTEHHPEPYLWRLLVDRMHQRRGIGRRILDLLVDELRDKGHSKLDVSWVDDPGSPRPFYERYGFVTTGRIIDGEIEGRLEFIDPSEGPASR